MKTADFMGRKVVVIDFGRGLISISGHDRIMVNPLELKNIIDDAPVEESQPEPKPKRRRKQSVE